MNLSIIKAAGHMFGNSHNTQLINAGMAEEIRELQILVVEMRRS